MSRFLFEVEDATGRLTPDALAWLRDKISAVAQRLSLRGQIQVRVVDDTRMGRLHEDWFGDPSTTDVITLDLLAGEKHPPEKPTEAQIKSGYVWDGNPIDADVVVCVDEAARHASRGGYPLERELLLYVVHAVMHCLGWDDGLEAEAAAMHRAEDALLEAVGVGSVFGAGGGQEDER
jgi:probable rRNA maturation factor